MGDYFGITDPSIIEGGAKKKSSSPRRAAHKKSSPRRLKHTQLFESSIHNVWKSKYDDSMGTKTIKVLSNLVEHAAVAASMEAMALVSIAKRQTLSAIDIVEGVKMFRHAHGHSAGISGGNDDSIVGGEGAGVEGGAHSTHVKNYFSYARCRRLLRKVSAVKRISPLAAKQLSRFLYTITTEILADAHAVMISEKRKRLSHHHVTRAIETSKRLTYLCKIVKK
jgi:histone H3/H4